MTASRRIRLAGVALACALALAEPALAQKKGGKRKDAAARGENGALVVGEVGAALDRYLGSTAKFPEGFSGCALVAKQGELLLEKGYGIADSETGAPMRADMLWDWCSVSKQFTAAAVLKLEMQKKLAIDEPLSEVFPKVDAAKAEVTLRQLMNHTSGISARIEFPRDATVFDREAMLKVMLDAPVVSEPGEKWEYNNVAYFLLAAIVEKVSGKPFERYCADNLFEPAGLETACMIGEPRLDLARVPRDDRGRGQPFEYGERLSWGYRGAGGVVMSCRDMLRWHEALLGDKVLSQAAKEKYYDVGLQDYALGWGVSKATGRLVIEHGGATGEVRTHFLRQMDDDIVVVLACNWVPGDYLGTHAHALETIARTGKAPDGL